MCHGDTIEVVEDEEVSEQVKRLRARLALVSSQIEVSQFAQPIKITDYTC